MTAKKIVFLVLELLFVLVVPVVVVILNYTSWGEGTTVFKITFSGVILLIVIFVILKIAFLDKYKQRLRDSVTQLLTDYKTETDEDKLANIKSQIKMKRTIECILNAIFPLLILVGLYVLCKALESTLVSLSGCVGWCAVSMAIGFVFGIFEAREV